LLVLVLTGVCAAPAGATIVPGKGMAGVKLRDCADTVRARLGQPTKTLVTRDFTGPVVILIYKARGLRATFHFSGNCQALTAISTSKGQERTAKGIGKGTGLHTLKATLKGEHCTRSKGRVRSCHLGSYRPGRVVTEFRLNTKRRVTSVLVGRVID
jgi:hypothetical protein